MKMKIQQNFMKHSERMQSGEFIAIIAYIKQEERSQIST